MLFSLRTLIMLSIFHVPELYEYSIFNYFSLVKDAFAAERRKAKMLNFSIAYGKTPVGLARDWKVASQNVLLSK